MSTNLQKQQDLKIVRELSEKHGLEIPKNLSDAVALNILKKMDNNKLEIPQDYAVGNALQKAFLMMKKAVNFNKTTSLSQAEALLDMVCLAQYPDLHGYFIAYADQMTWFQKYTGKQYVLNKALGYRISAVIIYEGDNVTYEIKDAIITNIQHTQSFDNIDSKKILGAYAICLDENGDHIRSEIMTYEQIKTAWKQSTFNKEKNKFEEQFAKRTVINRITTYLNETLKLKSNLLTVSQNNEHKHFKFETTTPPIELTPEEEANQQQAIDAYGDEPVQEVNESISTEINDGLVTKDAE